MVFVEHIWFALTQNLPCWRQASLRYVCLAHGFERGQPERWAVQV